MKRGKYEYPYSYDDYVLWGGESAPCPGERAVYSDRLWQWDAEKFERCWAAHCRGSRWDNAHRQDIEAFMRAYTEDPELQVTCLTEGCNRSNGYPYWVVYYHVGSEALRREAEAMASYEAERAASFKERRR